MSKEIGFAVHETLNGDGKKNPFQLGVISLASHKQGSLSAALFVDFENISYGLRFANYAAPIEKTTELIRAVIKNMKDAGVDTIIRRAYGGWQNTRLQGAARDLQIQSVIPSMVFLKKGKNSADFELGYDAHELLFARRDVDVYVIVGSDSDYLPLARRIREAGRTVFFVGPIVSTGKLLMETIGSDNFIDSATLIGEPDLPDTEGPFFEKGVDSEDMEHSVREVPIETQLLTLLLECEKSKGVEIWLGPFMKNNCRKKFPAVDQSDLWKILEGLDSEQAISIQTRDDKADSDRTFRIIKIDHTHPKIKALETE